VRLAQQVGSAIDAARSACVVHRDIKPQNLFLSRRDDA
jgi:serine/threonine protein kinase